MHRLNVVKVMMVRDGTLQSETRKADDPEKVAKVGRDFIGDTDREHCVGLVIDARHNVRAVFTISIGTLTASLIHPREVFKPAILGNAAGVIVVHNHPSGDHTPSPEDREVTTRLARAGEILGIPLVDHVIVSNTGHYSFREGGLL